MEYRNAKYLDGARIDCEINHPTYGWIPFTCDPTDTGAAFDVVALYDAMGRKVTDLREEYLNIDTYSTTFNAADLPSGTYHVRLMHDLFTVTTSVSIIK